MSAKTVEKAYHPNGQLRWQATIKDGKPVGIVRHWHENGVLAQESPHDNDGLGHGISRAWNAQGQLLGEFVMDHGTGVSKSWYENGQLESEIECLRGQQNGRMRCWLEDGSSLGESYHIRNRDVSKKKYFEACKTDETLPRYESGDEEPEEVKISGKYRKRESPISDLERDQHNQFIAKFLDQPNRSEARKWLAGDKNRYIGQMTREDSVEFIEEGYKAGASKIMAVEIEDETTNCLIVELPKTGRKRERVFEWNGVHAQDSGFDPYEDWGQNELFVYFD